MGGPVCHRGDRPLWAGDPALEPSGAGDSAGSRTGGDARSAQRSGTGSRCCSLLLVGAAGGVLFGQDDHGALCLPQNGGGRHGELPYPGGGPGRADGGPREGSRRCLDEPAGGLDQWEQRTGGGSVYCNCPMAHPTRSGLGGRDWHRCEGVHRGRFDPARMVPLRRGG